MNKSDQYDIKQAAEKARQEKFARAVQESDFVICSDCGCGVFVPSSYVRRVSGLAVGSTVDLLQPMPVYMCSACGRILTGNEELDTVKIDDFNDSYGRKYTEEELIDMKSTDADISEQTTSNTVN